MANITAADIGYSKLDSVDTAPGRFRARWVLTIPNTANVTYPTGGVPINAPLMIGARGIAAKVAVIGQGLLAGAANQLWVWNGSTTAPKLVAYVQGGAAGGASLQELSGNLSQGTPTVLTIEVENG